MFDDNRCTKCFVSEIVMQCTNYLKAQFIQGNVENSINYTEVRDHLI